MEATTCLCDSFLHCQSLPGAYLLSQTQISLGWINKGSFLFLLKAEFDKADGGKIIYKDTKRVEAFQNFRIVSGIRTWSISTWIKSMIFLTVFPNRQQSRYKMLTSLLYAFCPNVTEHPGPLQEGLEAFMSLCKLFPSGLSSVPSPNQDWNPSFFLF